MLNIENKNILDTKRNSTWCTLSIDKIKLKAKIQHIGRGKFKILGDENGDKYINNIVDASDIFHCR